MKFKRLVCAVVSAALVLTQTYAIAGPTEEARDAGAAANGSVRSGVTESNAKSVVPKYTNTPQEATLKGTDLKAKASEQLYNCLMQVGDPNCDAQLGAMKAANTKLPEINPYDPSVQAARNMMVNPEAVLGDLSTFYQDCTATKVSAGGSGTVNKVCSRQVAPSQFSCTKQLTVDVELFPNCEVGTWFKDAAVTTDPYLNGQVSAQCRPRDDDLQRIRFKASTWAMGCKDEWTATDLPTAPSSTAVLGPQLCGMSGSLGGGLWGYSSVAYAVIMPNSGCVGGKCKYDFQLGAPVYQCGSGQMLFGQQCYIQVEPISASEGFACPVGAEPKDVGSVEGSTTICVQKVGPATLVGASRATGWPGMPLQLVFDQPKVEHTETDRWTDGCPALEAGGRCSIGTGEVCTDGPSKHSISGVDVERACWAYERKMSCMTDGPADQCGPLAAAGCTLSGTTCAEQDAGGTCLKYNDTYTCPGGGPVTTVSNCSQKQYCLGQACFDIGFGSDKDLARSLTMLEAVREAGVYIDPDQMEVFAGEANSCRNKLLKNCCYTENAGVGMNNGSMFGGVGSFLVFDVLMNSKNRNFVWAGMKALMTGAGFTGSFSSYGITLAVNGAEFSADAAILYASSDGSIVIAFDPWSLALTIAVMVIMKMMECEESEGTLALKRGAKLCHEVGEYCSDELFFGGCIEHTTGHCCFNSVLARIVNEQGRLQVGKDWGTGQKPNCSGFTITQLQKLDFSKMDLTEFYASIVPANVNSGAAASGSAAKVPGCYYGKGKC